VKINVNSAALHCSVMIYDDVLSHGIAEASNMSHFSGDGEGIWYLNRVKARTPGQGHGTVILTKLQETLAAREDFRELRVEPGGYGSDIDRVIKFYESRGFVQDPSGRYWLWTNPSMTRV